METFPPKLSNRKDVINFFKTKFIGEDPSSVNFESLAIDFLTRWKRSGRRKDTFLAKNKSWLDSPIVGHRKTSDNITKPPTAKRKATDDALKTPLTKKSKKPFPEMSVQTTVT